MAKRISGKTAAGRDWSFEMEIDPAFDGERLIEQSLSQRLLHEPDVSSVFTKALQPGDNVIDCGANVGWFSLLAAALVGPAGMVRAYDPDPVNWDRFEANVARNGFANVTLVKKAVSDAAGPVTFYSGGRAAACGGALWPQARDARAIEAETVTLDGDITDDFAGQLRLIKIDIMKALVKI